MCIYLPSSKREEELKDSGNKHTGVLGTADVRSWGPLCGSRELLPPKTSVSKAPPTDRTNPNQTHISFTAQCRSASVRAACQSGSRRVHLLFIHLHRSASPLGATSYPLETLAPEQKHARGWPYTFIRRCAVVVNVALHLWWINSTGFASAFVLRVRRGAHEREAFTRNVVFFGRSTRERVNALNRFFWMILSSRTENIASS